MKSNDRDRFRFDDLLHPARAFARPADVVADSDLTLNEKRAILASWASDACAASANPAMRQTEDGVRASWDDIMDALRRLDVLAAKSPATRAHPDAFWRPRRGLALKSRQEERHAALRFRSSESR